MKFTIEIDDDKLRTMIDNQVAAGIASMTTEAISKRITEILDVKFNRVTGETIDNAIQKAADAQVKFVTDRGYPSGSAIREALAVAATRVIKEARL